MTVRAETATVYRGGRRRFFTLRGAIRAEAVAIIKRKHPHVPFDPETGEVFHWTGLPRSDVLLRRMCRLVKSAITQGEAP